MKRVSYDILYENYCPKKSYFRIRIIVRPLFDRQCEILACYVAALATKHNWNDMEYIASMKYYCNLLFI